MIIPRKLRKGDRVAIVSLSSGMLGEDFCSHNIEIAVNRLKEYFLEPIFMPNSLKGIEFLNLKYVEPLGYLEFNYLVKNAKAVITDSGGITEETTVMNIPCLTLRDNTERPETVTIGTNELVGTNPKSIALYLQKLLEGKWKKGNIPEKWDGKTADRIIDILLNI